MLTKSPGKLRATSAFLAILFFAVAVGAVGCARGGRASGLREDGRRVVRLAFFPNVTHAVALVGTGSGAFTKALGPDVVLEERVFTAGPAEIEALFAGEVDIGYIGPGPALNGYLKSRGKALRIIAGASSGGAGLVVHKDARIARIEDLAGKKVAVPQTGGTQDISLRHALREAGLRTTEKGGDVAVLQMAPADTLNQFKRNQLDAAWVPEPWVSRLEVEGDGKLLIDERDRWPGGKFATTVVIARTEFLERQPELIRRFLRAHVETVAKIERNPDAARRLVGGRVAKLTGKPLPDELLRSALARTDITADPLRGSVLTFADWSEDLGYQREGREALTNLFDLGTLDAALAEREAPPAR